MRTIIKNIIFKTDRGKKCLPSEASIFEGHIDRAFIRGVIHSANLKARTIKIGNEEFPFIPKQIEDSDIWEIFPIIEPRFGNSDSNLLTSSQLEWARQELETGREVKLSARQAGTQNIISDIIIDITDDNILIGLCGFYRITIS